MYVSFILVNIYPILTVSFQIIIAFVNNANVTENKNLVILSKWLSFTEHIAEWNVLFVCKTNTRITKDSTSFNKWLRLSPELLWQ